MKIQDIEKAVMKQLPPKKHYDKRYSEPGKDDFFNRPEANQDRFLDVGMVLICGLSEIYINDAAKKIVNYYDIDLKGYTKNVNSFKRHLKTVALIFKDYGVSDYKTFSEVFWIRHNKETEGERFRSGIILSHVVSSKKEFSKFIKDNPVFTEDNYLSFFIFNKAQLSKNYLSLNHSLSRRQYVDHLISF